MIRNVLVCDLCAAEIPAGAPHAVVTPTGPGARAVLAAIGPVASFDACPRCAEDLALWLLGRKEDARFAAELAARVVPPAPVRAPAPVPTPVPAAPEATAVPTADHVDRPLAGLLIPEDPFRDHT